ncbi:hypothetical protein P691DRAFT_649391, partial [Macrolepiota fuliginosa MF-IS2]
EVLQEANTMTWASALMGEVYKFVDDTIQAREEAPPFVVLRMQMVKAFVITCNRAGGSTELVGGTTLNGTYLVEEVIKDEDGFIKYINNTSSSILLQPGTEGYEIAIFLSFAQHIQYVATHQMAFVSDFQGEEFEIDESISSIGKNLFGHRNLEAMFHAFPDKHQCNHFCHWFRPKPL